MLSAREKAEAARYKPSKKKTTTKKKKVDMRSAREKAEASFVPKKKKKTAVTKSLKPKARGFSVSKTTITVTPARKLQNERRRNILSEQGMLEKQLTEIQKKIDANLKRIKQVNKK